jgi:preprotein translocase subunit SecG
MNLSRFTMVLGVLLLTLALALGGCQKKEEAAQTETQPMTQEQPAASDTTAAMPADTTQMAH